MLKYKHIEAAREVRLWVAQVIVPVAGVMAMSPEARQAAAQMLNGAKNFINRKRK